MMRRGVFAPSRAARIANPVARMTRVRHQSTYGTPPRGEQETFPFGWAATSATFPFHNTRVLLNRRTPSSKLPDSIIENFFDVSGLELLPTSRWTHIEASSLVHFTQDESLGTPSAAWDSRKDKHSLAQRVFMGLTLKKRRLQRDMDPTQHVKLPTVMEKNGLFPTCDAYDAAIAKAATAAEATELKELNREAYGVKKELSELLFQFQGALSQAEAASGIQVKRFDLFTTALGRLCGLTAEKFKVDRRRYQLQLWGSKCGSEADVDIIGSVSEDLVIIFGGQRAGKQATPWNRGHIGRIVGNMLMMKQHNESTQRNNGARDVYAVRIINYHVAFFKLRCTSQQLKVLSDGPKGSVPTPLPQLFCSHQPQTEFGYNLLAKGERAKAIEAFTAIRELL